ncbi:MAG: hypothetical protein IJQ79_09010 [Bacteroidales bacterium]|nr:hypothetical protein [Bacteroidales bacterium]
MKVEGLIEVDRGFPILLPSKLVIGGYIRFTDTHFAPQGVDIRIVGVKTFLCDPYAPTIEISNSIASAATFSSELRKPDAQEVKIEQGYRDAISFTKRRWRDANETMEMLEESLLANFTSRISPIAVNTMQLLVGDESLQYVFVDSETEPQSVIIHTETWNNATKTFTMGAGILKHMTLGITELAGMDTHELSDYKYWNIPAKDFVLASSALAEKSYYLYAKCAKNGTTGEFVASETAIAMEGVPGYYHFLVGILNSEFDGGRSYVPMYGFTEILPGRITTDKIVSGQGTTFWDLVANVLNLGGKLQYNTQESGAGNLLLKGTLIQTGSGEPTVISAYCGDYDATRVYQLGDIVSYTADGVTSTYRYVNSVASSGHLPTDLAYWKVETAGTAGQPGYNQATIMLYKRSSTPITAIDWSGSLYYLFSTNSLESTPTGWSRSIPSGTDPVYVTMVSVSSRENRVQITDDKWPNPVELVENGTNGRGIVSSVTEYTVSDQGTVAPSSNWQSEVPSVSPGYYLWTRTTITYTSGEPSVSYSVSRAGSNGDPGSNGYSYKYLYKSQDEKPSTPTGTNPSPSGWSDDPSPATTSALLTQIEYRGEWVRQTSGSYNGWYKCPAVADDASCRESFFFETFSENTVIRLDVAIACEANNDFLLIGKVDATPFYDPDDDTYGGYEHFVTSDVSGTMKTVQVTLKVKRAGVHKIDFLFCKDHSQTNVDDVYVKYNSLYREYKVWMTSCKVQDGSASGWTTPICINGDNGANADAAAACVYRGDYNVNPSTGREETMVYWGLSGRTDIVRYNNRYYRTNPCVGGSFSDIPPTYTAYWMDFGANFDSVATGFLFAEEAVLEKAVVRKLRTNDTGARIQAEGMSLKMLDADNNVKLNIAGENIGSVPQNTSQGLYKFIVNRVYSAADVRRGGVYEYSTDVVQFSVEDDANSINLTGDIGVSTYISQDSSTRGSCYINVAVSFVIDEMVVVDPANAAFNYEPGDYYPKSDSIHLSDTGISLTKGTHTLKVVTAVYMYGSSTFFSEDGLSLEVILSTGTLAINYPIQKVEIGANGFRAMFSGNQFAQFIDENGTPVFMIRNGNYCLRVSSTGVQKSVNGGSSWTNL